MSKRSRPTQRRKSTPTGTTSRSRAVVAEFGPKPNFLTWKAFHYLAANDPDKLRSLTSRRPAALDTKGTAP